MTFDKTLPHPLPWNYPWIKDEIERRDEYIAQLEAELAHQKPQNHDSGAIDGESVKIPAEDESGAHSEPDSREKLEFEIRQFIECNGWFGYPDEAEQYTDARKAVYEMFIGWLDRQASITEREFMEIREDLTADNLWMHERIAELQQRVDELTAERDELRAECEDLERANNRQARKIHNVCEANSKLTAERDRYREALGKAIDCADEIRRLA